MGEKEGKSAWKHYSHVLSYQDIRKIVLGIGHLSIGSGEFLGEKCWLRFTIEIGFSQMPIHKYVAKYIKTWIYC